jgi:hypothetical protein
VESGGKPEHLLRDVFTTSLSWTTAGRMTCLPLRSGKETMSTFRRLCALAAASTLTVTGLTGFTGLAPAQAVQDPTPVEQGATWLTKQSFFNAGARIDALQQFVALGRTSDAVAAAQAVKDGAAAYATSAAADAKLIFAGDLVDQDANTWGAGDLVAAVASGINDTTGRIDTPYSGPESQALAVRALSALGGRTENAEYATARDYLLSQQCTDGAFEASLQDSACTAPSQSGSADSTALVVLYLSASADTEVAAALDRARQWLSSAQQADGSWQSDGVFGAAISNANSTGLAALALGSGAQATKAAAWLRSVQIRDAGTCTTPASKDRGAIAYTPADYNEARTTAAGLDEGQFTRGSWVFATQQTLGVLRDAPQPAGALRMDGSTDFVRARSSVRLVARNIAPVSMGCLTGPNVKESWTAGSTGSSVRTVVLPRGTGIRVYRVVDSAGRTASHAFKVLGATTLGVKVTKSRVHRRGVQRVTVHGLAPGEPVRLRYRGLLIRRGVATASGTYTTSFRVGRSLGTKRLVAVGKFGDIRRGLTTFRVVR